MKQQIGKWIGCVNQRNQLNFYDQMNFIPFKPSLIDTIKHLRIMYALRRSGFALPTKMVESIKFSDFVAFKSVEYWILSKCHSFIQFQQKKKNEMCAWNTYAWIVAKLKQIVKRITRIHWPFFLSFCHYLHKTNSNNACETDGYIVCTQIARERDKKTIEKSFFFSKPKKNSPGKPCRIK